MRAVRTILHKNNWTSATLLVMLMLWVSGGPFIEAFTGEDRDEIDLTQRVEDDHELPADDQEPETQVVLSSLEAAVIPVCKIQLAFFCSFMQEATLVEKLVERVAVATPLPQSNYFRTLFQRIIMVNAPRLAASFVL